MFILLVQSITDSILVSSVSLAEILARNKSFQFYRKRKQTTKKKTPNKQNKWTDLETTVKSVKLRFLKIFFSKTAWHVKEKK